MSDLRDQARRALTRGHHRRTTTSTSSMRSPTLVDTALFDLAPAARPTLRDVDSQPITVPAEPAIFGRGGSREDQQP